MSNQQNSKIASLNGAKVASLHGSLMLLTRH